MKQPIKTLDKATIRKQAIKMRKSKEIPEPSEKIIHQQVCDFINLQYADVIFSSDASGLRVTIGVRQEIARKSPKKHKVPDLIILEPKHGWKGLIIEIKKKGTKTFNKDGKVATKHLEAQFKSLELLSQKGYFSRMCMGYEECERIIKGYMAEF